MSTTRFTLHLQLEPFYTDRPKPSLPPSLLGGRFTSNGTHLSPIPVRHAKFDRGHS